MKYVVFFSIVFYSHIAAGQILNVQYYSKPISDSATEVIDVQISKYNFGSMDILRGGYRCEGIPSLFMISPVIQKDTGYISSGHLSCYSVIYDFGKTYCIAHVDADNIPSDRKIDSTVKAMIRTRIHGKTVHRVLIGASNFDTTKTDSLYIGRYAYLKSLTPDVPSKKFIFFSGPNARNFTMQYIIENGGVDMCCTTDVIFWDDTIIVVRPDNEQKYNHQFNGSQLKDMLKKWRK